MQLKWHASSSSSICPLSVSLIFPIRPPKIDTDNLDKIFILLFINCCPSHSISTRWVQVMREIICWIELGICIYVDIFKFCYRWGAIRQMMAKVDEEMNGGSAETEGETKTESGSNDRGCCSLRGIQWRIKLGVLRSSKSSVDELRRAAADGRRKWVIFFFNFLFGFIHLYILTQCLCCSIDLVWIRLFPKI